MSAKRKTPNQKDSMRRSAERRRCPKCQRKSALGAVAGPLGGSVKRCRFCYHECGSIDGKPFGFAAQTERVQSELDAERATEPAQSEAAR